VYHEKNVSAQPDQTCQDTWFQETHVHPAGTKCNQTAQSQRQKTADGLSPYRGVNHIDLRKQNLLKFSYTKADRILKRSEFLRLSKSGRKIRNRYFIAYVGEGNTGRIRLGVTATRRTGNAVIRNRMKRLCREFFRVHRDRIAGKRDISIVVTKEAAQLPGKNFFLSLQNLFDRIEGGYH